jgi:hypothetical protein
LLFCFFSIAPLHYGMVGFHYLKFLMISSSRDYSPKVTKAPPKIWMIQFAIKP